MRFISPLFLILCLAACQRGGQNNSEEVRQGVIDHLTKAGYNVAGMEIKVATVKFDGEKADASVNVTAKGNSSVPPMTIPYHLEHQNNKWVVVGPAKPGGHGDMVDPNAGGTNPHGGAMPPADPGAGNPHGGGMPPASGGSGKMPSPQDLPPATKK